GRWRLQPHRRRLRHQRALRHARGDRLRARDRERPLDAGDLLPQGARLRRGLAAPRRQAAPGGGVVMNLTIDGKPFDVEIAKKRLGGCFLGDSKRVARVGVFIPNAAHVDKLEALTRAMGAVAEGKQRVVVYGVCLACWGMGTDVVSTAVDAKIFGEVSK